MKSTCCVCLNLSDDCRKIDQNEALLKLRYVAPEVEWSEDYNICQNCAADLLITHNFRSMCLQLDPKRKTVLIFTCFHCGATFGDKLILTEHLVTHQEVKSESASPQNCVKKAKPNRRIHNVSCEVCNLVLNKAKKIIEHCCLEHSMERKNVKPYVCDECPMRFGSSANIIQHKKYHEGSRTHICSFCGKSYITKSDLTVHEYTHYNRRNYKCEVCSKAFNTNKNLRSHMLVVHTDSNLWKHKCDLCNKKFPLKSGYEQHMKRHNGDKSFICDICGKSFVSRSELQKHMGNHTNERTFKCEHCEKEYKDRRNLGVHLVNSHGVGDAKVPVKVRNYACHVCPSTFFDRQKLERHLRTHSGVKPFTCVQCDKKMADKYYLKRHMKKVHNLVDF